MKQIARVRSSQPLGPEPYAGGGDAPGVAWGRGTRRPAIELGNQPFRVPTLSDQGEGHTPRRALASDVVTRRESETLCMRGDARRENREILLVSVWQRWPVIARRNGQPTPQVAPLT